jgi:hypothetical protein
LCPTSFAATLCPSSIADKTEVESHRRGVAVLNPALLHEALISAKVTN